MNENDLVYRLRKRAEIRRQIPSRKSVQEGQPDRIADLLEEAANEIERLRETSVTLRPHSMVITGEAYGSPNWCD
jgi:malonyl CoA-acyl carrier protein transacylase